MAQGMSGGRVTKEREGEVHYLGGQDKIVINKVEVIKRREVITVPEVRRIEEFTTKYIPQEEQTIKYIPVEEETTRYNVRDVDTTKYNTVEKDTIKYNVIEEKIEKPVCVDKPYERPVITNKEYELVTYNDLEAIREAMDLLPKLIEEIKALRKYKIVEEIIKVPKIEYEPTTIKKIKNTGELIADAD